MPRLRLLRSERYADQLPQVCMACGEPAEGHVRKKFSYDPGWVYLLLLVNLLIFLIVYFILLKSMTVEAPMCRSHQSYWRKRTLWLLLPFLAFLALFIGGIVLISQQPQGFAGDDTWIWAFVAGSIALLVIWLVVAGIVQGRSIRTVEIIPTAVSPWPG
jgi:hypothetical protein